MNIVKIPSLAIIFALFVLPTILYAQSINGPCPGNGQTIVEGGSSTSAQWGAGVYGCWGNAITGFSLVYSFSYNLEAYSNVTASPGYYASVYNVASGEYTNNINITDQLPSSTSLGYVTIVADYLSTGGVALDANSTYYLVFCPPSSSSNGDSYTMEYGSVVSSWYYQDTLDSFILWTPIPILLRP